MMRRRPGMTRNFYGARGRLPCLASNNYGRGRVCAIEVASPLRGKVRAELEQVIEIEAEPIGSGGHWIELARTDGEGRKQYAVFDPSGTCHGNIWGKDAAEFAARQLMEQGVITR